MSNKVFDIRSIVLFVALCNTIRKKQPQQNMDLKETKNSKEI